jgi:glycerophosphoryl diester phosphodiesterase
LFDNRRIMPFDLQGHRGARGLKPENSLPSFEAALDAGVSTIETDVHLTQDRVPVLCHDPTLDALAQPAPGQTSRWLSQLTLTEVRQFRVSRNPDQLRFPTQDKGVTPAAARYADAQGIDPYAPPTLGDLFAFAVAYAGAMGEEANKTPQQRQRAGRVRFDLELKRVPFEPVAIGDEFDGATPALLEQHVLDAVRSAGVLERTIVRSFDHRSVRAIRQLEPKLTTAVLIAATAPIDPVALARAAEATIYCPDYRFVDEAMIRLAHAAGLRVIPWTVNRPEDWERLVAWNVDGVTTDYPDRLATWLSERTIVVL